MSESEYKEYISTQDNKEIARVLSDKTTLSDIRKMYKEEAIKRFIDLYNKKQ